MPGFLAYVVVRPFMHHQLGDVVPVDPQQHPDVGQIGVIPGNPHADFCIVATPKAARRVAKIVRPALLITKRT